MFKINNADFIYVPYTIKHQHIILRYSTLDVNSINLNSKSIYEYETKTFYCRDFAVINRTYL